MSGVCTKFFSAANRAVIQGAIKAQVKKELGVSIPTQNPQALYGLMFYHWKNDAGRLMAQGGDLLMALNAVVVQEATRRVVISIRGEVEYRRDISRGMAEVLQRPGILTKKSRSQRWIG